MPLNTRPLHSCSNANMLNNRSKKRMEAEEKYNKLRNEISIQGKVIERLKYEEFNPYINALDPHLNEILDIINICLSYMTTDYCVSCNDMFPSEIKCFLCCQIGLSINYVLVGKFVIYSVGWAWHRIKLYHEDDISFFKHIDSYTKEFRNAIQYAKNDVEEYITVDVMTDINVNISIELNNCSLKEKSRYKYMIHFTKATFDPFKLTQELVRES